MKIFFTLNKDTECISSTNILISIVIFFYCLHNYQCLVYLNQQYGSDERAKEKKRNGQLSVYVYIHLVYRTLNHQSSIDEETRKIAIIEMDSIQTKKEE